MRGLAVLLVVALCLCPLGCTGTSLSAAATEGVALDKLSTKDLIRYLKDYTHRNKGNPKAAGKASPDQPVKRGIVIPADETTLPTAAAIVKIVRVDLESKLPIEVAHSSPHEAQSLWVEWMEAMEDTRVVNMTSMTDALQFALPAQAAKSYFKLTALRTSSFTQILFLDGVLPLVQPELLFELVAFKRTGAAFWGTYLGAGDNFAPSTKAWAEYELSPPWVGNKAWRRTDSSQFIFDKTKHNDVLGMAAALNSDAGLMNELGYEYSDTFELAFALAAKLPDFNRVAFPPRMGIANRRLEWHQVIAIVQNSPVGFPLFWNLDRVARWVGKRDGGLSELPVYLSPPLRKREVSGLNWREEGGLGFPTCAAVDPEMLECAQVDPPTLALLRRHDAARWGKCTKSSWSPERGNGKEIPLLPPGWLHPGLPFLVQAVHAAVGQMRQAVTLLLEYQEAAGIKDASSVIVGEFEPEPPGAGAEQQQQQASGEGQDSHQAALTQELMGRRSWHEAMDGQQLALDLGSESTGLWGSQAQPQEQQEQQQPREQQEQQQQQQTWSQTQAQPNGRTWEPEEGEDPDEDSRLSQDDSLEQEQPELEADFDELELEQPRAQRQQQQRGQQQQRPARVRVVQRRYSDEQPEDEWGAADSQGAVSERRAAARRQRRRRRGAGAVLRQRQPAREVAARRGADDSALLLDADYLEAPEEEAQAAWDGGQLPSYVADEPGLGELEQQEPARPARQQRMQRHRRRRRGSAD